MTSTVCAPGLTANWLNGWLAAVGVTLIVPEARLGWSDHPIPEARFEVPHGADLAEMVAGALPGPEDLAGLAIAGWPRNVSLSRYREAAIAARSGRDHSIAASVTDLVRSDLDNLPHNKFDPSAPRGETLFTRLRACQKWLVDQEELVEAVRGSLTGRARRIPRGGLGFDFRRLRGASQAADLYVDPVVECLCFEALTLFPVRGDGYKRSLTRGWNPQLTWPAWTSFLDCWAIDALLDVVHGVASDDPSLARWGVLALYKSVAYERQSPKDQTTGYASRRIR